MRKLICISCPIGCRLTVYNEDTKDISAETLEIEGNRCPRGVEYALAELTAPARVVTATVAAQNSVFPRLPVKTAAPFPKDMIAELLSILYSITIDPSSDTGMLPAGSVILDDALGTGIDVVTTRGLE